MPEAESTAATLTPRLVAATAQAENLNRLLWIGRFQEHLPTLLRIGEEMLAPAPEVVLGGLYWSRPKLLAHISVVVEADRGDRVSLWGPRLQLMPTMRFRVRWCSMTLSESVIDPADAQLLMATAQEFFSQLIRYETMPVPPPPAQQDE